MKPSDEGAELIHSYLAASVRKAPAHSAEAEAGPTISPAPLERASRAFGETERAAEIRKRILEGAYDSLEVVDQVARRMLGRGDI